MKPLFIPLKKEYFLDFKDGWKDEEFRLYGHRWNEKTCFPGRPVVLSLGYGKLRRLRGKVKAFKKQRADEIWSGDQEDVLACYGTLDVELACIKITDLEILPLMHGGNNQ